MNIGFRTEQFLSLPKLTETYNFHTQNSPSMKELTHKISTPGHIKVEETLLISSSPESTATSESMKRNYARPRTKITSSEFKRISNVGFCLHANGDVTYRCYSSWCNFKIKSREKFSKHVRDHHKESSIAIKLIYCNLCKCLLSAQSVEHEISHMENVHLKPLLNTNAEDSSYESKSEISSCDEVRNSIDSEVDLISNIKQEHDVDNESEMEYDIQPQHTAVKRKIGEAIDSETKNNEADKSSKIDNIKIKMEPIEESDENKEEVNVETAPSTSKKPRISMLRIASIESADQVIIDPDPVDLSTAKPKEPEKAQKKINFVPKPVKDIFLDQSSPKSFVRRPRISNCEPINLNEFRTEQQAQKRTESTSELSPKVNSTSLAESSPKIDHKLPETSKRVESSKGSSSTSSSCPSPNFTSPKSSRNTHANRIFNSMPAQNLRILHGSDLMCWTADVKKLRSNQKYEVSYKNMLKKNSLISLFKCMGKKCSYTTDDPTEFFNHLMCHDQVIKKERDIIERNYMLALRNSRSEREKEEAIAERKEELRKNSDYFNYCPYCLFKGDKLETLAHHINDIHRKDIFQCGFCFFRTCCAQTCLEHLKKSHKNKSLIVVYQCPGKREFDIVMSKANDRLLRKRETFVKGLKCKICNIEYFPVRDFLNHCENFHRSEEEQKKIESSLSILEQAFKARAYGMYQCLYCLHGSHQESDMLEHLLDHPAELGFYCLRGSLDQNRLNPNRIESTTIVKVKSSLKAIEFKNDRALLCTKDLKETIDADLEGMLRHVS